MTQRVYTWSSSAAPGGPLEERTPIMKRSKALALSLLFSASLLQPAAFAESSPMTLIQGKTAADLIRSLARAGIQANPAQIGKFGNNHEVLKHLSLSTQCRGRSRSGPFISNCRTDSARNVSGEALAEALIEAGLVPQETGMGVWELTLHLDCTQMTYLDPSTGSPSTTQAACIITDL